MGILIGKTGSLVKIKNLQGFETSKTYVKIENYSYSKENSMLIINFALYKSKVDRDNGMNAMPKCIYNDNVVITQIVKDDCTVAMVEEANLFELSYSVLKDYLTEIFGDNIYDG